MIEYEKRAMIEAEDKYTFRQSTQISMQTGLIGHLRADMDTDGNGFFSSWFDLREELKTDEFKAEFDDVINSLREEGDILHNRRALAKYCYCTPQSRMQEEPGYYGVRVDTEKYAYLLRLNPDRGEYNLYCYCYRRDWLDQHLKDAEKGIRFIDSHYKELFRIPDGGKVKIHYSWNEDQIRTCRYIDDYHVEIGSNLYHICEFAERMEYGGHTCEPVRDNLPERCYSVLSGSDEIIIIKRGEKGYFKTDIPVTDKDEARSIVNEYNTKLGVSMEQFQYFVIEDQLHKEKLALKAAELVPEDNVIIVYDRAVFDDKAYISDEQFVKTLAYFGKTEEEILAGYDAVLHLVTCAKGAEFAYNFGNAARYENVNVAREKDDLTLRAWAKHPKVHVIDNSVDFEDKINRAIAVIYSIIGLGVPQSAKRKYLIEKPDCDVLISKYGAVPAEMMQTYLTSNNFNVVRRVRQEKNGSDYLYFYTEKRIADDGTRWITERPISEKQYIAHLMECDMSLHGVRKTKYRFTLDDRRFEIDIYPFSDDRAIMFVYFNGEDVGALPPEIEVIKDVTGDLQYKNRSLAKSQML